MVSHKNIKKHNCFQHLKDHVTLKTALKYSFTTTGMNYTVKILK